MKRFSAQYIYDGKQLYPHYVIELKEENGYTLFPLEEELHSIEFYNGLLMIVETPEKKEGIKEDMLDFFRTNKQVLEVFYFVSERKIHAASENIHIALLENIDLQKFLWLPDSNVTLLK